MRQRLGLVLTLIALAPLLMGGSAAESPLPSGFKFSPPTFIGVIVIDTHDFGVTDTAKRGSIWIRKAGQTAGTVFDSANFPFAFGCDLTQTETRFLNRPLDRFIPPSVVQTLFGTLQIAVTPSPPGLSPPANVPAITDINSAVCTPGTVGGVLSMEVTIQFITPK